MRRPIWRQISRRALCTNGPSRASLFQGTTSTRGGQSALGSLRRAVVIMVLPTGSLSTGPMSTTRRGSMRFFSDRTGLRTRFKILPHALVEGFFRPHTMRALASTVQIHDTSFQLRLIGCQHSRLPSPLAPQRARLIFQDTRASWLPTLPTQELPRLRMVEH